jgi:hypothetical protein
VSGTSGVTGDVFQYLADDTEDEEITVRATNTGITATRDLNVISFVIPANVTLLAATIRIKGANVVGGQVVVDTGFNATGWSDRFAPNFQVYREDTGNMIAVSANQDIDDFDRFTISGCNASATNYIKLVF